jgi:hypothetical protein
VVTRAGSPHSCKARHQASASTRSPLVRKWRSSSVRATRIAPGWEGSGSLLMCLIPLLIYEQTHEIWGERYIGGELIIGFVFCKQYKVCIRICIFEQPKPSHHCSLIFPNAQFGPSFDAETPRTLYSKQAEYKTNTE